MGKGIIMDELEALKSENESLKNVIKNGNAERIAIDQIAMNNIKENVHLRTQNILLTNEITDLNNKITDLENIKNELLFPEKL